MGGRTRSTPVGLVAAVLVLSACGSGEDASDRVAPPAPASSASTSTGTPAVADETGRTHVSATGSVIAERGVTRICSGVMTSLPPQCGGGVVLTGLDPTSLPGAQTQGTTTWTDAETTVVGWWDGEVLAVERSQPAAPRTPPPNPSYAPPCPEPDGGWQGAPAGAESLGPVTDYTTEQPETFAGLWWDEQTKVPTVRFTGKLEEHRRALAERYEHDVCVIDARYSQAELSAVQAALTRSLGPRPGQALRMLSSGADPLRNVVDLNVVIVDDVVQREVDRHPEGMVRVTTFLQPVAD